MKIKFSFDFDTEIDKQIFQDQSVIEELKKSFHNVWEGDFELLGKIVLSMNDAKKKEYYSDSEIEGVPLEENIFFIEHIKTKRIFLIECSCIDFKLYDYYDSSPCWQEHLTAFSISEINDITLNIMRNYCENRSELKLHSNDFVKIKGKKIRKDFSFFIMPSIIKDKCGYEEYAYFIDWEELKEVPKQYEEFKDLEEISQDSEDLPS